MTKAASPAPNKGYIIGVSSSSSLVFFDWTFGWLLEVLVLSRQLVVVIGLKVVVFATSKVEDLISFTYGTL